MPKDGKGGKGGKKKSKKNQYRKCLGQCFPKTVCPPDYSTIEDDMDWQMSPFSIERFELDEIQRLEKKGVKAKRELEALKRRLAGEDEDEYESCVASPVKVKSKKKAQEIPIPESSGGPAANLNCSTEILYQPYGPLMAPVRSYSRPFNHKQSVYCYLGPSHFSAYRFKVPAPGMVNPVPCPQAVPNAFSNPDNISSYTTSFGQTYVPLGP